MNIIIEVLLKMLTYAIILGLVSFITRKIYITDNLSNECTMESYEVDKKKYAKIFLVIAIGISLLIVFVSTFMPNVTRVTKYVTATIVILINLFLYMVALYCFFDLVQISQTGFYIRKGFFAKRKYSFQEISF